MLLAVSLVNAHLSALTVVRRLEQADIKPEVKEAEPSSDTVSVQQPSTEPDRPPADTKPDLPAIAVSVKGEPGMPHN